MLIGLFLLYKLLDTYNMEKYRNKEIRSAANPTLFVCLGVSGAGLTTAINSVHQLGLTELAPPQFVTRALRPNEKRGDQYYPVTKDILDRIPKQIAMKSEFYGNTYGFFYPAVRKIQQILETKNVIVDSGNPPSDWNTILNAQFPIVSLFFAPDSPFIAISRIIERSRKSNDTISIEDILKRSRGNAEMIQQINSYDYWINTTNEVADFVPTLASIIQRHSFDVAPKHLGIKSIQESQNDIAKLLEDYKADPTDCIIGR